MANQVLHLKIISSLCQKGRETQLLVSKGPLLVIASVSMQHDRDYYNRIDETWHCEVKPGGDEVQPSPRDQHVAALQRAKSFGLLGCVAWG